MGIVSLGAISVIRASDLWVIYIMVLPCPYEVLIDVIISYFTFSLTKLGTKFSVLWIRSWKYIFLGVFLFCFKF